VTFGRDLLKELHRSDPESAREIDQAAFSQFDQVVDIHGKQVLHPGGGGHDGNIVLAGDAAHTTHYTIGSGTTMAIEDAIALAGNLQQHHGEQRLALQSYERQRKAALLRRQSDARFSARWFESISRYVDLEPHEFSALLHGRRSPLLPHLPPHVYYRLHQATEEVSVLGELRRRVGPKVKAIYSDHKPAQPGNGPAIREHVTRWN
jgi:2-polyprenyl-6-methoxyphenol hydroxylase-like FAD-dependent oxidoreductase